MERIIESVRKHPCLWNSGLRDFNCAVKRSRAWSEVVKECNFTDIQSAKRRWKNLRDMHRQVLLRRKQTTGIHRKWKYEDQMEYLVPVVKLRPKEKNTIQKCQEEDTEMNEFMIELQNDDEDYSVTNSTPTQVKEIKNEHVEEVTIYTEDDPLENEIVDPVQKLSRKESALRNFFMNMFETTSNLPDRLQLSVQRQVFNAVMEAQEEILSE